MKGIIFPLGLLLAILFGSLQLSLAATDDELEALFKQVSEQCTKETSVSVDELKGIMAEKSADMDTFSDKMKCFLLCIYKKLGFIDGGGKPVIEPYLKFMMGRFADKKDKVKPALDKCIGVKETNPCEAVFKFEFCMVTNVAV